jgi:hypothetical protein
MAKKSSLSFLFGLFSIGFLAVPEPTIFLSFPLSLLAIHLGNQSIAEDADKKTLAITGKLFGILSIIGLCTAVLFAGIILLIWYTQK